MLEQPQFKQYIRDVYNNAMKKRADLAIRIVQKHLNNLELIRTDILGEDLSLVLQELEMSLEGQKERKQNKIRKRMNKIRETSGYVMVAFYFNHFLNKIVYSEDVYTLRNLVISKIMYTGVIDLSIPAPFMFGRVTNKVRHGGGRYVFANLEPVIDGIYAYISDVKKRKPDINPFSLVEDSSFITFLSLLSKFEAFRAPMKEAWYLQKKKMLTGNEYIDILNGDPQLVGSLKKIWPYGNCGVQQGNRVITCLSDVDITVVCFPFENKTVFQVIEAQGRTKRTFIGINALVNYLVRLHGSSPNPSI